MKGSNERMPKSRIYKKVRINNWRKEKNGKNFGEWKVTNIDTEKEKTRNF